ncbi:orotidine-5'-phosphate decarboxylase [Nitrosophilus kaiyonis]|uniref:orotidine-5'-phosphate decarboxylase n=1 Tax=Nitrosophilus kaiyonis TaxID=2930200 RepID=UPI00249156B3|nr:orotidine-5'-phosphate decarboxylase [Nitrosophilus kaiyonis]
MKLCVALDLPTKDENIKLARNIKDFDIWLKVGLRSYIRDGKEFIQELKEINSNFNIFLDLKLYDIPNTMADAAEEIAKIGVEMFNIHASAGKEAMNMVMQRLKTFEKRPLVLAVTVLTSFDEKSFKYIYNDSIENKANQFSIDAYKAGLDGVVCSVFESKKIKELTSKDFITLTPGIRPFGEDKGDQKRVADLKIAKENLSDFIVVGRPIYKSSNPKEIVEKILTNL